jgi:hypothetical protein
MFNLIYSNCVGRDTCVLVITTALVMLYAFVTTRTVTGRQIYAVGGDLFLISHGMPFAYERPLASAAAVRAGMPSTKAD